MNSSHQSIFRNLKMMNDILPSLISHLLKLDFLSLKCHFNDYTYMQIFDISVDISPIYSILMMFDTISTIYPI